MDSRRPKTALFRSTVFNHAPARRCHTLFATTKQGSRADGPPEIAKVISISSLRDLPQPVLDRLMGGARVREIPAGESIHEEGDEPFVALVVSGLIRAYISAPNGRTMTIRYCRPGSLMGTGTAFNTTSPMARGNLTALVDSSVVAIHPATLRRLADRDIRVTRALLAETSARVADYINELRWSAFASLRQRLARHLLDLAAERQSGREMVARANQEELAAAVGTVREIVVRILHEMRAEGLVRTRRGAVELLDPVRIELETETR